MELSFTEKKSIRKNFGKLKEILSIPNLIEVQKKSYKQFLTITDQNNSDLQKGFDEYEWRKKSTSFLDYIDYRSLNLKSKTWSGENIKHIGVKQVPLILSWAITIHKSQGSTIPSVHIDLDKGSFDHGQTYVALSRTEEISDISLSNPIKNHDIKVINFKRLYPNILFPGKNQYIEELIKQKNARLSSQGIKDIFKLEDLNFYKNFERKKLSKIKTHLSALSLNNELIAIHWGIIYNRRFYYLLLSMKEDNLKKYSPGRLLISLLVRWSIAKKMQIFDFTLGEEGYKKSWVNRSSALHNYIQLSSLRGLILYILIKIKLILKLIYKKNISTS